jgi:hypothetical protein
LGLIINRYGATVAKLGKTKKIADRVKIFILLPHYMSVLFYWLGLTMLVAVRNYLLHVYA